MSGIQSLISMLLTADIYKESPAGMAVLAFLSVYIEFHKSLDDFII